MAESKIQWTDRTWNPTVGCSKVSAGCANCYAVSVVHRLAGNPNPKIRAANHGLTMRHSNGVRDWTGVVRRLAERLDQPKRWKTPCRIFVNSLSDLFHDNVPDEYIDRVFEVMASCPEHTFQILTKRPPRMRRYMLQREAAGGAVLANVWLGVSVEDPASAEERVPQLLTTPAAIRWVSYEPALAGVDFRCLNWASPDGPCVVNALAGRMYPCGVEGGGAECARLDWIVIGGESGASARPFHLNWLVNLIASCRAAGVPLFIKQLGRRPVHQPNGPLKPIQLDDKHGGDWDEWSASLRVRQWPDDPGADDHEPLFDGHTC